jgi:hypothetical protein
VAATAWRCSQCGTVNEPGARACRECGKWPSLFDLQDSAVDEAELAEPELSEAFEPETFETETLEEPETFEPSPFESSPFEPGVFGEEASEEPVEPARRFPRWLITAAIVVGWILWYLAGNYLLPD